MPKGYTTKHSSIKSLNQKIRRIARTLGVGSTAYENYVTTIDRNFNVHYTKDGIIQIDNVREPSVFQTQQLVKLSRMHGVKEKMKLARKHLREQGIKKPTKEQQLEELKKFETRQRVIDNTLDMIYDEETTGHLPSDISDIVDKMRGRVTGQGITNAEIDIMIDVMKDWADWKERAEDISTLLHELDYVSEGAEQMMYDLFNSDLTSKEYKQKVEDLEEYYNNIVSESEV